MSFTLELFEGAIPNVLAEVRRVLRVGGRVGIVAMSDSGQTNAMIDLYEWLHRRWPHFIDCRPIDVVGVLQEAHFQARTAHVTAIWGLPVIAAIGVKTSAGSQEGSTRMTNRRSRATPELPETLDLDPILDFMRLLWSVEHGLQSTSKRMEATLGITGPQRLVLRIVTARPGLSAGELARIVHLHPSTITGILQRLVRKGLLRRERDRRDTRRIRLHSQAAAKGFVPASAATVESAVTRALAHIPRHRVRHAREVLAAIAKALTDDAAGAPLRPGSTCAFPENVGRTSHGVGCRHETAIATDRSTVSNQGASNRRAGDVVALVLTLAWSAAPHVIPDRRRRRLGGQSWRPTADGCGRSAC